MTSSCTAISMWNASSFLLGPFRDQYKCWFLNDLNSIDILYLHNCFQIPPAALWYRSDNENFLGRVTKSSLRKLDNQRGLWTEERLFWGIPLNQLFKLLVEGHTYFSCGSRKQNQSTQNIKECLDNIFSICVHLVTTNYTVHFITYIYVHCTVYSTIVHSTLQYLVRSIGGYVNEARMLRRGW